MPRVALLGGLFLSRCSAVGEQVEQVVDRFICWTSVAVRGTVVVDQRVASMQVCMMSIRISR